MRGVTLVGGIGAAVLALGGSPLAQAPPATFSASSELVVLHVGVTDHRGRPVSDLDPGAFRVTADGRPHPVRFAGRDGRPVTAGLVVDGSGSMWPLRAAAIEAVGAFAAASRPDDELFGLVFHDTVDAVLPEDTPFTADGAVLQRAFARRLQARGRTSLYDAVDAGLAYAARGTRERKVLVVVSDGGDNASVSSLAAVERRAQASNVTIFAVALEDSGTSWRDRAGGRHSGGRAALHALADGTGGTVVPPVSPSRLARSLGRIAEEIRAGYLLGFEPAAHGADGRFHVVDVQVSDPRGRALRVHTRTGYRAGRP